MKANKIWLRLMAFLPRYVYFWMVDNELAVSCRFLYTYLKKTCLFQNTKSNIKSEEIKSSLASEEDGQGKSIHSNCDHAMSSGRSYFVLHICISFIYRWTLKVHPYFLLQTAALPRRLMRAWTWFTWRRSQRRSVVSLRMTVWQNR